MNRILLCVALLVALAGPTEGRTAPAWCADAIWYQVFPERFRNGDPDNDPTPESLAGTWPYVHPEGWRTVPWTADWYRLHPWEQDGKGFYVHAQLRRYGGDLQGILDSLDYLHELGVNALYLNPVFDSPSLHKYGAARFHHIDRHFGPDPDGDARLFAREDPADPSTWQWSAADRLFLRLIREVHARDMRIIIDGVFNHVGIPFWAFQKARAEGPESRYADWFHIRAWDDPSTPADEFDYRGWAGIKDLPEFRKDGDTLPDEVQAHIRAVLHRWMDPDGDGDPADGIDGWRLDVAAEVPLRFWKDFRGWVKALNPEAFLTGEIWWEDYRTVTFRNAAPWLNGAFDAVMNYRFGDAVYQFFNQPEPITAGAFVQLLTAIESDYGFEAVLRQQNLFGSHDTARIGSAVVNPHHRQDHGANLQGNRDYLVRKPNADEKQRWRQMVAFQFLMPGAPFVYYGDEVGMWGADDPDCRKPMVWPDLAYDPETAHPFDLPRPTDTVEVDPAMLDFYRTLAALRNRTPALRQGTLRWRLIDDHPRVLAFERTLSAQHVLAVFNVGPEPVMVQSGELGLSSWTECTLVAGSTTSADTPLEPGQWTAWLRE